MGLSLSACKCVGRQLHKKKHFSRLSWLGRNGYGVKGAQILSSIEDNLIPFHLTAEKEERSQVEREERDFRPG